MASGRRPVGASDRAPFLVGQRDALEVGREGAVDWRRRVDRLHRVPPDIRRVFCTASAIEGLTMQLRRIVKTRGDFPTDEAGTEPIGLPMRNVLAKSNRPPYDGRSARKPFAVLFGDRFALAWA